jgi:hypothetical protein
VHVRAATALLVLVHAAALGIAVVLAGLLTRWAVHRRRTARRATGDVPSAVPTGAALTG